MKTFGRHTYHYLPLMGIFVLGTLAFVFFPHDRKLQLSTVVAVCTAYITWGVVHHAIHRDLYLVVVLEYIMTAIIGFLVLASLIYQA